jgi:hypothetical protein
MLYSQTRRHGREALGEASKRYPQREVRHLCLAQRHGFSKEDVFGYLHLKTTDLNPELGLELPVGNSTCPGNTKEGTEFIAHRRKLAVPLRPGQKQLGDSAYGLTANLRVASRAWCYRRL